MNWGHKIIIVYLLFVAGMVFLVVKSSQQNKDLVTEDYYAKELVYQEKIDQFKRVAELSAPVTAEVKDQQLHIKFPADFATQHITGNLVLYCPADEQKDKSQSFSTSEGSLVLNLPSQYRGLFYVKINWVVAGTSYYVEKKIIIES